MPLIFIMVSIARAVINILYPVFGLLAESCCLRYKILVAGNFISLIGVGISAPALSMLFVSVTKSVEIILLVVAAIGLVIYQFGQGLFEANAIQFGMDQLVFCSTEDIKKFICWYFWGLYSIPFAFAGILYFLPIKYVLWFMALTSIICISITLFFCRANNLITEQDRRVNPVKLIFKVLDYARRNSQPTFRSAFTYGEAPPSRLDLAKERYGGPFTTEQVEDVKSFGRILLILVSLFGLLLTDDISTHFTHIPSIGYLVTLVGIPLYMIVLYPFLSQRMPSILKKMGAGLVFAVGSLTFQLVLNFISHCFESSDKEYVSISLTLLSQICGGLSLILIFLSALEFILAQAPRSMQGLLIGLWYACEAVSVMLILFSTFFNSCFSKTCFLVVKTVLAFLSLVMYIIVSRCIYQYRLREELSNINRQAIIEEYTERQLLTQDYFSVNVDASYDIKEQ